MHTPAPGQSMFPSYISSHLVTTFGSKIIWCMTYCQLHCELHKGKGLVVLFWNE